jgi:hypothetical protein
VGGFAVHSAQSAPEKRGYDQEKARFFLAHTSFFFAQELTV